MSKLFFLTTPELVKSEALYHISCESFWEKKYLGPFFDSQEIVIILAIIHDDASRNRHTMVIQGGQIRIVPFVDLSMSTRKI